MLEKFAQKFRLKVSSDECGDRIIRGRVGHLYFDGPSLCLMVIDGPVIQKSRWKALGGTLWTGDISREGGKSVQDIWIKDIPEENWVAAIKLLRVRAKRELSPEQVKVLARNQFLGRDARDKRPSPGEERAA